MYKAGMLKPQNADKPKDIYINGETYHFHGLEDSSESTYKRHPCLVLGCPLKKPEHTLYDPTIALVGIYDKETKIHVFKKKLCMMFIETLIILNSPNLETIKMSLNE